MRTGAVRRACLALARARTIAAEDDFGVLNGRECEKVWRWPVETPACHVRKATIRRVYSLFPSLRFGDRRAANANTAPMHAKPIR
jgi:hypothetical protein